MVPIKAVVRYTSSWVRMCISSYVSKKYVYQLHQMFLCYSLGLIVVLFIVMGWSDDVFVV
jgi:hypothetical protein